MVYETIASVNMSSGLAAPFCYVNNVTGVASSGASSFFALVLVSIWIIFAVGSYYFQKRSYGQADLPQGVAVAGFVTAVFAFMMRLVKDSAGNHCMVSSTSVGVAIAAAIIGVLWLFFSKD